MLIHCEIFIKEFLLNISRYQNNKNTLAFNFYLLIKDICNKIDNNETNMNILKFITFIRNRYNLYRNENQNDSQEFLRIILEDFNIDLNKNIYKSEYKILIAIANIL